jgi:hypothetical protein
MSKPRWPLVLKDAHEISAYISDSSPGDVDEEFIEEFYFNSHARLEKVLISEIVAGSPDHNIADPAKQKKYEKLNSANRPPIVLGFDKEVCDGNHRLRDAIAKGETHIWAYVPISNDQELVIDNPNTWSQGPSM